MRAVASTFVLALAVFGSRATGESPRILVGGPAALDPSTGHVRWKIVVRPGRPQVVDELGTVSWSLPPTVAARPETVCARASTVYFVADPPDCKDASPEVVA